MTRTTDPLGHGEAGAGPCPKGGDHEDEGGACRKCRRFLKGNTKALVVGDRSAGFWRAAAEEQHSITTAVISDAGHGLDDAPRALRIAADGLAQAVLIQRAAFTRLIDVGGPLTSADRTRRAFIAWQAASDRVERYLRLVGLRRVPRAAENLAAYVARRYGAGRRPQETRDTADDSQAEGESGRAAVGSVEVPAGDVEVSGADSE